MKKFTAVIMALMMISSIMIIPDFSGAKTVNEIVLDTNGADGYTGDYVVAYNPSLDETKGASTGNLTGLIETSNVIKGFDYEQEDPRGPKIEFMQEDDEFDENEYYNAEFEALRNSARTRSTQYSVGQTDYFRLYYGSTTSAQFKVLAVGRHCYIWTPTSYQTQYALDRLDSSYAQLMADEFDEKYDKMCAQFGTPSIPDGSGMIDVLVYDVEDGWYSGSPYGYVAGFFHPYDYSTYGICALHIDSYPGIYSNVNGIENLDIVDTYNTMMHEFQHLINYSRTKGKTPSWLNESMSMAAEELLYPGSAVPSRIRTWKASQTADYRNGKSLYGWIQSDIASYGLSCLFGQYLRVQTGSYDVFGKIMNYMSSNGSVENAIMYAVQGSPLEGMTLSTINKNFRIAINTADGCFDGDIYSFKGEELFANLSPAIFTGSSTTIYGGGAITIRPKNGVFYPPSGAGSNIVYIGITVQTQVWDYEVKFLDYQGKVLKTDHLDAGEDAVAPDSVPCPMGMEHIGWDTDFTNVQSDLEVNAVYDYKMYDVHYDKGTDDEVSNMPEDDICKYESIYKISEDVPMREGYVFKGWKFNTTSRVFESGKSFTMPSIDVVLTAIWEEQSFVRGDANLDGLVDSADATLVLRYIAELDELTGDNLLASDINADGNVNTFDASSILMFVAEI